MHYLIFTADIFNADFYLIILIEYWTIGGLENSYRTIIILSIILFCKIKDFRLIFPVSVCSDFRILRMAVFSRICVFRAFLKTGNSTLHNLHLSDRLEFLKSSTQSYLPVNNYARSASRTQQKHDHEDITGMGDPEYFENMRTNPSIIKVPMRLNKRLGKKVEKESKQYFQRQKIVNESRKGSKSNAVITARRPELNYYKGQSYGRRDQIQLISTGWKHRKSNGDFFTVHQDAKNEATQTLEGREDFASLGMCPEAVNVLKEEQIEVPTLIQAIAIPQILKGKNNLLAAETGCGKTLSYLLPIFEQILDRGEIKQNPNQPSVLILLPTRELAEQVHKVTNSFGYRLGIRARLLQGGSVTSKASSPSTKVLDILVSTVSIISTLSVMDVYDLSQVSHIVLDEADTLLDDSFSEEVLRFLRRFPFDTQKKFSVQATLVSATMPRSLESILEEIIPTDSLNRITTPGLHRIVKTVPQTFKRIRKMDKPQVLLGILNQKPAKPTIVFTNKSETCHWVSNFLVDNDVSCVMVHGKMKPHHRKGLLEQYQSGEVDIMVCTDLGSRGIDTVRSMQVINYEFPRFLSDYVHRCGRVGRVGSESGGSIINLISSASEVEIVQQIETSVRKNESFQNVNANVKRLLNARYGMYKSIEPIKPGDEDD